MADSMTKALATGSPRWAALDGLRGLAVFAMVPVNAAAGFLAIPAWFKHAPGTGFTFVDIVMPTFLFSLGLSASFSLPRRLAEQGRSKTIFHAFIRWAVLFSFGLIGNILVYGGSGWEVMQMLACASALSFPLLFLPALPRIGSALLVLVAVEVARPLGLGELMRQWYGTGLAGPWGSFSLAALVALASGIGELGKGRERRERIMLALGSGAVFLALGYAFSLLGSDRTLDKHIVTAPYLMVAAAIASGLLAFLDLADGFLPALLGAFKPLGRNPFLFYIFSGAIILGEHALIPDAAPAWAAFLASFGALALCMILAVPLDKRRLYLKL